MPGGLVEPRWLPDGFVLVTAEYVEAGDWIQSIDLSYQGLDHSLHIWQTYLPPDQLAMLGPMPEGQPLDSSEWSIEPLRAAQVGRAGVVVARARLDDGRTVSIDSDLAPETMQRVLDSLYLRVAEGGGS
jgi:hypothetical protein